MPEPPPPVSNGADTLLNDPRVRAFAEHITQDILRSIMPVIGEIRPGGRAVEVIRRDAHNRPTRQSITTPQLLTELNDNLVDLIDELQRSNDLAEGLRARAPRRKR
jgi:hypothetical protein